MARKDSGRDSRGEQEPAGTPSERIPKEEAPTRRRTQRPKPAEATEATPSAPRGASRRRRPASGAPTPAEAAHAPALPEKPEPEMPADVNAPTPAPPVGDEAMRGREPEPALTLTHDVAAAPPPPVARSRRQERQPHGNALGILIERHFSNPASPCRSYSDLERRSGISREALSRYVTARPDRRRSPTIDTLVAIADAMHLSLEAVSRAAAASVRGIVLPPEEEQYKREEVLGTLVAGLTDEQFGAVVELLRHLRPAPPAAH